MKPNPFLPPLRVCIALSMCIALAEAVANNYYVNSSGGDDNSSGMSEAAAWKTLARASKAALAPGDRLLLNAGERFEGMLTLRAQGEAGREILIGAYGGEAKPILDGRGAEAAVRLIDPSHVIVEGLELVNEQGPYGVRVTGRNQGALGKVTLRNLNIHHVYQPSWERPENDGHGPYKYYGGINIEAERGDQPTWWEGIVIRDNELHDLGTCGISVGSAYPLHENRRRRRQQDPFPIRGVVIENNAFRDIARDGAIIRQCRGAILQHNDVIRTGRVSMSNGIWFWDCRDSVIRYNRGTECGVRAMADGGPFSVDYNCAGCSIEYNYSYNNEGPGFMAFGNGGTGKGTVIRGNVSYNDATAPANPGFAAVSMISELSETLVEDNIVIAGPDTRVLLGHHDWQGLPADVVYRGNVFVGNGKAPVHPSALQGAKFKGNLFINIPNLPEGLTEATKEQTARAFIQAMERRKETGPKAGDRTVNGER